MWVVRFGCVVQVAGCLTQSHLLTDWVSVARTHARTHARNAYCVLVFGASKRNVLVFRVLEVNGTPTWSKPGTNTQ